MIEPMNEAQASAIFKAWRDGPLWLHMVRGAEAHHTITVRRLIAEAVAAEREACAALCSEQWQIDGQLTADEFAAAIRARGDKT